MDKDQEPIDYNHPVAYDAQGRPLYARPLDPQAVHISRPVEPAKVFVSDDIKSKHDQSIKLYPSLNLSESEYVISSVKRHLIGIIAPFIVGVMLISLAFSALFNYDLIVVMFKLTGNMANVSIIFLPMIMIITLIVLATYITYYVYTNNKLYLTNESLFQTIQTGLFTKREQVVNLQNIEDASYTQDGIVQQLLNYGSIRLSTIGDENTYKLSYVAKPKDQIDVLNNAVEAFKNGRPVENR